MKDSIIAQENITKYIMHTFKIATTFGINFYEANI